MPHYTRKPDAPFRSATEVGPGDFVKIGQTWREIASNTAQGSPVTPKSWEIKTRDGTSHDGWGINRYAKAEDIEKEKTDF
jgi:hypothetical protein